MKISRTFTHRKFGEIGTATLIVPDGDWTLDGKVLPIGSVEHLATFALQTLQDAYAGSETEDEAKANWQKKLTRLMDGTLGTRGGEGLNDVKSLAIYRLCVATFDAEEKKRFNKAFDTQSARVRKALEISSFDEEIIAAEIEKIETEREAKIAAENARRETVAKLAGKVKIDF